MTLSVLAINPGNTSTKIGYFRDGALVSEESIRHPDSEISSFTYMNDQLNYRVNSVQNFLNKNNITQFDAIVGRGGILKPLSSGTYLVNEKMLVELKEAARGEHASNLGAPIAYGLAQKYKCNAYIVDPVAVDELEPIARMTGIKGIERESLSHALNMKAVAKRYSKACSKKYEDMRLIVVHLGSGTSLSAHVNGKMVDVVNPKDEGPMSADRAGAIPASALVDYCFRPDMNAKKVKKILFSECGMFSHLGTRDMREALAQASAGDNYTKLVIDSMFYQVSKYIGQMAVVLQGKIDAILLTGGMAFNHPVVEMIKNRTGWIAPITVYPGEDELQALAEGAYRVIKKEETAMIY